MVWADLADQAGASSGDVKVDALAAWLTTHDKRLANLESGAPAPSKKASAEHAGYQRRLEGIAALESDEFMALLDPQPQPDEPAGAFLRVRIACMCVTAVYTLLWVLATINLFQSAK